MVKLLVLVRVVFALNTPIRLSFVQLNAPNLIEHLKLANEYREEKRSTPHRNGIGTHVASFASETSEGSQPRSKD